MPYQHNNRDPNLNNLHHAMEYQDDLPHLRVTLGSDNINEVIGAPIIFDARLKNSETDMTCSLAE